MTEKNIIELLKSGNFTIAFHDNNYASLYKGRISDYDDLENEKVVYNFSEGYNGYIPGVVAMLVTTLKGKVLTI